jgi:uncharacterized membrane protein (UPF0127 family)
MHYVNRTILNVDTQKTFSMQYTRNMKLPRHVHLLLIGLGVLVLLGLALIATPALSDRLFIKDIYTSTGTMRYEIVRTQAAQEKGLGGRTEVPVDYGMLFIFSKPDRYGFWMKDMLVPIDILWLSDNGTVILIDYEVQPSTYPNKFFPPVPVRYVLETRAGYASERGWKAGDRIDLPPPYGN